MTAALVAVAPACEAAPVLVELVPDAEHPTAVVPVRAGDLTVLHLTFGGVTIQVADMDTLVELAALTEQAFHRAEGTWRTCAGCGQTDALVVGANHSWCV